MKIRLIIAILTNTWLYAMIPVYAADTPSGQKPPIYTAKGEVITTDLANRKIKLKHEAIPELNWPGMTMFFSVVHPAQMTNLKQGDLIEFQFDRATNSVPQITHIRMLQPGKTQ